MVQRTAMREAVLHGNISNFMKERLVDLRQEDNWWSSRISIIECWLLDEKSQADIPLDGMEGMIRKLIERGSMYPIARFKCWSHIRTNENSRLFLIFVKIYALVVVVLELQYIPCFAKDNEDLGTLGSPTKHFINDYSIQSHPQNNIEHKLSSNLRSHSLSPRDQHNSPTWIGNDLGREVNAQKLQTSRGGNSQDQCPDSMIADGDASSFAPTNTSRSGNESPTRRHSIAVDGTPVKKLSEMTMMERQAAWLQAKRQKVEAERQRKEKEDEKELTFQPKLIRRATFSTPDRNNKAGITALPDITPKVQAQSQHRLGSASVRNNHTDSTTIMTRAKPGIPKHPTTKVKKKKFVPPSQLLEITSNLLSSSKMEVAASQLMSQDQCLNETNEVVQEDQESQPEEDIVQDKLEDLELSTSHNEDGIMWTENAVIDGMKITFDADDTKARIVLQDATNFDLHTMYRKTDRKAGRDGIALHMGRREDTHQEEVIAVLFDKEKVSHQQATQWWADHRHRFDNYIRKT